VLTPYDWQEGIGHRASYVESKLAQGAPVIAVSLEEGILMLTYRRHARKIFEIYDQLIFGAIGQQSDVEALRTAAIDFAHQEGFNRSEEDVTIQRVVTALSAPLKRAFADFNSTPVVARSLFAEVGEDQAGDSFHILDYDGDFTQRKGFGYVAGSEEAATAIKAGLKALKTKGLSAVKALEPLKKLWSEAAPSEEAEDAHSEALILEAALIERGRHHEQRFRSLAGADNPLSE
jgi:proteasome alpha subunit